MKVLLVGNGAREHALAKHLVMAGAEIDAYMKHLNPGIASLANSYKIGNFANLDNLLDFKEIDFAVIGPERPLALGMVDYLNTIGIPVLGPNRSAVRLETSKIFARTLLANHKSIHVANPTFFICRSIEDLEQAYKSLDRIVIKPDGLTGGIGVKIQGIHLQSFDQIKNYGKVLLQDSKQFLVEEFLDGQEFTLQAFCDGSRVEPMPLVQDYRSPSIRHSLGSVSAQDHGLPSITTKDIDDAIQIIRGTFRAMYEEHGVMYQGILYGQFIKTEQGVKMLEFNCRFGDPEALNVLALLEDNLADLCYDITQNKMGKPQFKKGIATMALYLVPKGFPQAPVKDSLITIPNKLPDDVEYFYGAVYQERKGGDIRTIHKRSLALFSHGKSISDVREKLHNVANMIVKSNDLTFSHDIGKGM